MLQLTTKRMTPPRPASLAICIASTLFASTLLFVVAFLLSTRLFTETVLAEPVRKSLAAPTPLNSTSAIVGAELGAILFDSNLSGSFGIYELDLRSGTARALIDTPDHEMFPQLSPDGSLLTFALAVGPLQEGRALHDRASVWIANRDGSAPRKISSEGSFPSFTPDGSQIVFERKGRKILLHTLKTGEEREIFPASLRFRSAVRLPRISRDGARVSFTSDTPSKWHAWSFDLKTHALKRIARACQPQPLSDDKNIVIKSAGARERSGIFLLDRHLESTTLHDGDAPLGHEYFPTLSADERYLLFSAGPPEKHDHYRDPYELFLKDLHSGELRQLTKNGRTNRWAIFALPHTSRPGLP